MFRHQSINVILTFGLLFLGMESYAQHDQEATSQSDKLEIPFYLPITQEQFPGLTDKLESALKMASHKNAKLSMLRLRTTDYWHPYQHGIRQGRPAIYFAAPHFASWLVNNHSFEPTLRLSGTIRYVIAVRRSDSHIFEVSDLANKTICTQETMSLSFLLAGGTTGASKKRSLLPAKTLPVRSVVKEMQVNSERCDAFSLSEHVFRQFSAQLPFQFIRLQQSREFSNYSYLLHPSISPATKSALRAFLVSKKVAAILQPMYRLFAKQATILSGEPNHYPPSQMLLLQPYWGSGLLKAP